MAKLEIKITDILPIGLIIRRVQSDTFDFAVGDEELHSELNQLGIAIEE